MTDIAFQASEKGYPFGWVFPDDGVPVLVDGIALVKNKKSDAHAQAARDFYEFVTSLQAGKSLMTTHWRLLTRTDIRAADRPGWQQGLTFTALPLDWKRIGKRQAAWMKHWDQHIKGRGTTAVTTPGGGLDPEQSAPDSLTLILIAAGAFVAILALVVLRRRAAQV